MSLEELDELDQYALDEALSRNPHITEEDVTLIQSCGDYALVWYKVPEEWGWGEITHDFIKVAY